MSGRRPLLLGIHGLGNKPPRRVLQRWWKRSLREGLLRGRAPAPLFAFELVYWADHLHPRPLRPDVADAEDPLFLDEPYVPAAAADERRGGRFGCEVIDFFKERIDRIALSEELLRAAPSFTERMVRKYFMEVDAYFSPAGGSSLREESRRRLAAALARHRGRPIVLIAHSLGSVIAYDVLSREAPGAAVDTFITIGSPLGIPYIIAQMKRERGIDPGGEAALPVPDGVQRAWGNFADAEDRVGCHFALGERFRANRHGVRPRDAIVSNDYRSGGRANPHKSFGYLRCPEVADLVRERAAAGKPRWRLGLETRLSRWLLRAGAACKPRRGTI